jgi:hypothetical protein
MQSGDGVPESGRLLAGVPQNIAGGQSVSAAQGFVHTALGSHMALARHTKPEAQGLVALGSHGVVLPGAVDTVAQLVPKPPGDVVS